MHVILWSLTILTVFTQKMSCKAYPKGRSKGTGKEEHHWGGQGRCSQFVLVDEAACLQWDSPRGLGWVTDIRLILAIYMSLSLYIYVCVCVCVHIRNPNTVSVWGSPFICIRFENAQFKCNTNKLEIQFSLCSMCKWNASLFKSFQYSSRVTCKRIILHFAVWELFLYNC